MIHRYLPMTEDDRKEMLQTIGVQTVDELFADIPNDVAMRTPLQIGEATSETDLLNELSELAQRNANTKEYASFLGAGVYDHYIPSIVDHVISRSEFYTAYTPYQPEISQGELQAIFEFQTMICELTGMDVANSSMYDGGTALAEAAVMSVAHTKRKKVLLSDGVHPEYRHVVKTYAKGQNIDVIEVGIVGGTTSSNELKELLTEDVAVFITQYPNFYGCIEPLEEFQQLLAGSGALFVVATNPLSLGVLTPPGAFGVDICVGDAQPLGIPQQFGGPHCGFFATKKAFIRKIPGRLVGETVDEDGKRGFVLTLQAREQHIRRDKATSNICSNQALNALAASVAMTALGKQGVQDIAHQNLSHAHFTKELFREKGFTLLYDAPSFNEFVIQCNAPISYINEQLLQKGIIGGFDLGRVSEHCQQCMLIAVTEQRTEEQIRTFVEEMEVFK